MALFFEGYKTKIKKGDKIVYSGDGCVTFLRKGQKKQERLFFAVDEESSKDDKKLLSPKLPQSAFDGIAILVAEAIGLDYELEKDGDPKTGKGRTFKFV